MASSLCWSCSSKLAPPRSVALGPQLLVSRTPQRAPFHSTAPQYRAPASQMKKPGRGGLASQFKFREQMASKMKPRPRPTKSHRYTPQEHRALQKPVSIANVNALAVPNLQTLSMETITDKGLRGQVLSLPPKLTDRLRALRAFADSAGWGMFQVPTTVLREETLELGRLIQQIGGAEAGSEGRHVARILTGSRGTGKSMHLVQAMTLGLMNDFVVINIPNAHELVRATTAYAPLSNTEPVQYIQKNATAELLTSIATANADVLSKFHFSRSHANLDRVLRPDTSLLTLAQFGGDSPDHAWLVFRALWTELNATSADPTFNGPKPFERRPPMVVTVDNIAHWMQNSAYFNQDYKPIHAHDLTLVNHFLSLLSSPSALPNGGLVLFATSSNNRPRTPALDISLKQIAARNTGLEPTSPDFPLPDPYAKLDARSLAYFNGILSQSNKDTVVAQEFRGISREETRCLLEFYARSGILRERITEEIVGEKWTLAGGGILGELDKFGRRLKTTAAR